MSYNPTWQNADPAGQVVAAEHFIRLSDAAELADAVNRRRLLTYQAEQDFSSDIAAGAHVRNRVIDSAEAPPYDAFRKSLAEKILHPPVGTLGGQPASPLAMDWLWPIADGDEDKLLVAGDADEGQVGLFEKLNGTDDWTDATLTPGQSRIRAVHINELRQAVEWIRRGRWVLPVYPEAGLFSPMPDTPWGGGFLANDGSEELRVVGFSMLRTPETPPRGLTDVTVRPSTRIELLASDDCTLQVHHCLREIDFQTNPPTWNQYAPDASAAWSQPGGLGEGDSLPIGSLTLTAGEPGHMSGPVVAAALQAMTDGAERNLLVRREDTGPQTVEITVMLVVEFDLLTPPN